MPPDTQWEENPNYLQGSVTYDDGSTTYDAAVPYDAPVANLTKVYTTTNPTVWTVPNPL